jgi:D-lactate dehydrogenase
MKDNVMLINTGRGQLIKTVDLIDGLKNHKIYAAGLDVYEEESTYFYRNYSNSVIADDILARLIFFPNVIVTSHQGFFTKEALENIASVTLQNIADFFDGKELKNEVFFKVNFEK